MKHKLNRRVIVFLILSVILCFNACKTGKRRKKKCDCPTWSYIIKTDKNLINGTSIQGSII